MMFSNKFLKWVFGEDLTVMRTMSVAGGISFCSSYFVTDVYVLQCSLLFSDSHQLRLINQLILLYFCCELYLVFHNSMTGLLGSKFSS